MNGGPKSFYASLSSRKLTPRGALFQKGSYRSILLSRGAEYLHHHFHSIRVTYDFLFSFSLTATIQSRAESKGDKDDWAS